MTKCAIQVEGLAKEYIIGGAEQRHDSFREMLTGSLTAPFRKLRKLGGSASDEERFWALKDVSFKVEQGEVLGIIGRNGAGKSTLLKILSRITAPTEGRVVTRGRVASLLEVGTGFHPELTGRENIFLNGAILGMSRSEIAARFDEIVAFSEIEKFLDTPVKRYSSGMYVRLAFSVAAHLETEVLLVDEVLAVGDLAFQEKCLGQMKKIGGEGRTVLFVSHNLGAISKLCSRGLIVDGGSVVEDCDAQSAVHEYTRSMLSAEVVGSLGLSGPLSSASRISALRILNQQEDLTYSFKPTDYIRVAAELEILQLIRSARITLSILADGIKLLCLYDDEHASDLPPGNYLCEFTIPPLFLGPGSFVLDLGIYSEWSREWAWCTNMSVISVVKQWAPGFDVTSDIGAVNLAGSGKRARVS